MSNSRAKYEEIKDTFTGEDLPRNHRQTKIMLDILKVVDARNTLDVFINKAEQALEKNPEFSPVVIFQIAADDALVDEFYS